MLQVGMRFVAVVAVLVVLGGCGGSNGDPVAAPPAPTKVGVTPGSGFVEVDWDHDGVGVTGFVISREVVTSGSGRMVRSSALTEVARVGAAVRTYRDDDVAVGSRYRYAVAALGGGGRLSARTTQAAPPVAPDPVDTDPDPRPDPVDPDPVDGTIATYQVGPGRVAGITTVTGVLSGYGGGASDAVLSHMSLLGPEAPGGDGLPVSVAPDGSFSVTLPDPLPRDDFGWALYVCDDPVPGVTFGTLVLLDASFGEAGANPTAWYHRHRIEEPGTAIGEPFLIDSSVFVMYSYVIDPVDISCRLEYEGEDDGPTAVMDVDVRLVSGWNMVSLLGRREGERLAAYVRTGEFDLEVPWVDLENLWVTF